MRDIVGAKGVISYGPCQFPTLGFIVERHKQVSDFVAEPFWYIQLKCASPDQFNPKQTVSTNFVWQRNRLFDKFSTLVLFEKVKEAETARVLKVDK